jgi:hypothetical protein
MSGKTKRVVNRAAQALRLAAAALRSRPPLCPMYASHSACTPSRRLWPSAMLAGSKVMSARSQEMVA